MLKVVQVQIWKQELKTFNCLQTNTNVNTAEPFVNFVCVFKHLKKQSIHFSFSWEVRGAHH